MDCSVPTPLVAGGRTLILLQARLGRRSGRNPTTRTRRRERGVTVRRVEHRRLNGQLGRGICRSSPSHHRSQLPTVGPSCEPGRRPPTVPSSMNQSSTVGTVSTLSNVVAVHHIAKTTRTSSTSPHATSPYAASRTPRGNSFIRLVVGEQPDEADDEPKDRHDHKRRDDYPADPTGWAARCPEPRPRVGVGRPTRCLL